MNHGLGLTKLGQHIGTSREDKVTNSQKPKRIREKTMQNLSRCSVPRLFVFVHFMMLLHTPGPVPIQALFSIVPSFGLKHLFIWHLRIISVTIWQN